MITISKRDLKGIILTCRGFLKTYKDLKIQCYKPQSVLLSEINSTHLSSAIMFFKSPIISESSDVEK